MPPQNSLFHPFIPLPLRTHSHQQKTWNQRLHSHLHHPLQLWFPLRISNCIKTSQTCRKACTRRFCGKSTCSNVCLRNTHTKSMMSTSSWRCLISHKTWWLTFWKRWAMSPGRRQCCFWSLLMVFQIFPKTTRSRWFRLLSMTSASSQTQCSPIGKGNTLFTK